MKNYTNLIYDGVALTEERFYELRESGTEAERFFFGIIALPTLPLYFGRDHIEGWVFEFEYWAKCWDKVVKTGGVTKAGWGRKSVMVCNYGTRMSVELAQSFADAERRKITMIREMARRVRGDPEEYAAQMRDMSALSAQL